MNLFNWIFLLISCLLFGEHAHARGIFSKVGASCLYVAANFTSFPFNCDMPDLAFKCRCQDPAFLGTVTQCVERHANDPHDLSTAFSQLVETCNAQGGKSWSFFDLAKINENATNYMVDYHNLPTPKFRASLVWKARRIHDVQMKNKQILEHENEDKNVGMMRFPAIPSSTPIIFNPYSNEKLSDKPSVGNKNTGMLRDGKVVGIEQIPNFENFKEIESIGVDNILQSPRFLLFNPVNVPDELYNISYNSVSKLMDQRNLATRCGYYIYAYWGAVMLVAIVVNIAQWTSPYYNNKIAKTKFALWCKSKIICPQIIRPNNVLSFRTNSIADNTLKEMVDGPMGMFIGDERVKAQSTQTQILSSELLDESNQSKLNELSNKLKKIKKASLKRSKSSKLNRNCKNNLLHSIYTMPVRMHALVVIGYLILNIVFCCVNYEIAYPNTVFTCRKGQMLVSVADRTGIIGTVQLPMVFMFSLRNNIFSNITGMSYRTFQMFHKWTSRIVFVLLVLHCVFYLLFVNVRGDYIERWGLLKWRCANTAFGAISITMIISFFRRSFYELFKVTHKIILVVFAIGSWYHCLTLGWIEYLGAAYAVWGIDYLIRWSKMISSGGILKGQCKVIFDTKTFRPHSIKIVVNHSGWWKPFPGCYCWIRILKYDMFWEAHPFTVISATSANNYNQLVFIIRVKDGLTKRLANYISKFPGGECNINLIVEGPYGNNIPFKQYDQSILVAGGVGLAVIYSIAMDLAQIYKAQELRGKRVMSDGDQKYISLIWLIPNFESLMAFRNEIESLGNFKDILEVQIFITRKLADDMLQNIIDEANLVNPLGLLSASYEIDGFKGFASALIKSANLTQIVNALERKDTCSSTREQQTITLKNNGSSSDDLNIEEKERDAEDDYDSGKAEAEGRDVELGGNRIIKEQRADEVEFLRWLISNNGEQISINFEDKPFLQDELSELLLNTTSSRPTALIACGPTTLNADVRLSVVKCLERGLCVDYYEEELLW